MKTKIAIVICTALLLSITLAVVLSNDQSPIEGFAYQPPPTDIVITPGLVADSEYARNEAYSVAQQLFGEDKDKCEDFQKELLSMLSAADGYDALVMFNAGGWGNTPLDEVDDEWDTVVRGIESWLWSNGYKCGLIEYKRCEDSVTDILRELKAFTSARYPEADELAAKIHFVTAVLPDIRVIMAGTSSGAMYSIDVMKLLEGNPRVFSILAGLPFWDKDEPMPQTLLMNYNGKSSDSLANGDLWAMFTHNALHLAGAFRPGTFVKLDDSIRAPGHDYSWKYPLVREQVIGFLENNFGLKD
ncbi:MAG: hypothetical protein PHV74_12175 [Dehalococcoidia bacterium]|nr:hypothetical protein [Dehalococcoidia bacterium]